MHRFPKIEMVSDTSNQLFYGEVICNTLKKVLQESILEKKTFEQQLPLITTTPLVSTAADISFYCVLQSRLGFFKFFYEMLTNWLVPGKQLNVVMLYAVDFKIPEFGHSMYTLCEVAVRVENSRDMEDICKNFPTIATELRLGVESSYHARRILEVKGLSADVKTATIQEHIFHVMNRLSHTVGHDVLTEMQHVLVMCRDDFKAPRDSRHLSRIIITQYLFRKTIHDEMKRHPDKRHVSLKLFRATLSEGRQVLGVVVGMTFLKDKEIFNKGHLLAAIQAYLPSAREVENSFFSNRRGNEQFCTLYLEIEKEDCKHITNEEISTLRRELPKELKSQVGLVMHPVFMPRNEEEIMRNILALSLQIKFIRDIPQLFITFDEQSQLDLYFTVIAVRVVSPGSPSIQQMFSESHSILDYIHDRCKSIGIVRKKHAKEATVFRVKIPKERFLRRDQTIDLYKARQEVVFQLVQVMGEFRDYNGGMISKQNELLDRVKELFSNLSTGQEELLDRLFYSLTPAVMRAVLEPDALKQLFQMQVHALRTPFPQDEKYIVDIRQTPTYLFAIVKSDEEGILTRVESALEALDIGPTELAFSSLFLHDHHYYGFVYRSDDPVQQWKFQQTLRSSLQKNESFLNLNKNLLG